MEDKKRDVVEAIIYNEKEEVLMNKKTMDYKLYPGAWCFFGGEIEKGENPNETLKREILEELGLEIGEEDIGLVFEENYKINDRCEGI